MLKTIGQFLADLSGFARFKEARDKLGGSRFTAVLLGTLGWIGIWVWLEMTASWPGTCDHNGRRLIGLVKELYCSAELLRGGAKEIALFAFLWFIPAIVAAAALYRLIWEWRRRS